MTPHEPIPAFLRGLAKAEYQSLPSERLLGRYVAERDEAALAVLVDRFAGLVYRRCRSVLRRDDLAREAFQETFRALVEHAHRVRRVGALGPWLNTTAYRQAVSVRRRERRRSDREALMVSEPRDWRSVDPVAEVGRREARTAVTAALAALPDRYRVVLELVYLDGKSHAEAAEALGCPKGTVDSSIKRGLDRLRTALGRAGLLSVASAGVVETVLAGEARALSPELTAAAVRAAGAVSPIAPAAPAPGWLPSRWVFGVGAMMLLGSIGGWLMWNPRPPASPPTIAARDPELESLEARNLRLFQSDILPRMAAEFKPMAFNGGEVVVTQSSATDTRVFAELEARHKDAPLGLTVSRLRVAFDTDARTECYYLDEQGKGAFHQINPEKPWVLYRVSELKLELSVPSEPLRRARAVLAELPPDSRAATAAAEHLARVRAAVAPLLGRWHIGGSPNRLQVVSLSAGPGLQAVLYMQGPFGPYLWDLTPRPNGVIDYAYVAWTTTRLSPDGRRLTFEPSGEWWQKAD